MNDQEILRMIELLKDAVEAVLTRVETLERVVNRLDRTLDEVKNDISDLERANG